MSEEGHYLTGLRVIQAFAVQDLDIPISDSPTQLRHLILTGPNGSGKSTILRGLVAALAQDHESRPTGQLEIFERALPHASPSQATQYSARIAAIKNDPLVALQGLPQSHAPQDHVLVNLPAKRSFSLDPVTGPKRTNLQATPAQNLSRHFLQHLVNKRTEQAYAREDNDTQTADALAEWFDTLTEAIRTLFGDPELELQLDRKTFVYRLVQGGDRPTTIEELPDGLRSVLRIWAEILMHVESLEQRLGRPATGFVLIDEVELHLHAELQERLLPFLTQFFPRLQFIVTTHSPAVASSIDNATVFDLRTHEAVPSEELRGQRYGDLFTDWFGIETDFDLETTRELQELHDLAGQKPAPGTKEHIRLEALAHRLGERSHLLALQIRRELEAARD